METKVVFSPKLPNIKELTADLQIVPEKILLIADSRALRDRHVSTWVKNFPLQYKVKGGERLKNFANFPSHFKKISRLLGAVSRQKLLVVALGGGTTGDFTGFFASVFKRGVNFIQIPTTWLAATDSAHGGKNGLNLDGVKNQIGTFHFPIKVFIVNEILKKLPDAQIHSAYGEVIKMALLSGDGLLDELLATPNRPAAERLWEILPKTIAAKNKVVEVDPHESSGERQILNLGHTMGHALEAHYGLAHGEAVALGISFAVSWSQHRGFLKEQTEQKLLKLLHEDFKFPHNVDFVEKHGRMSRRQLVKFLEADKKLVASRQVNFIFLEDIGRVKRQAVQLDSLLTEAERQGWINR